MNIQICRNIMLFVKMAFALGFQTASYLQFGKSVTPGLTAPQLQLSHAVRLFVKHHGSCSFMIAWDLPFVMHSCPLGIKYIITPRTGESRQHLMTYMLLMAALAAAVRFRYVQSIKCHKKGIFLRKRNLNWVLNLQASKNDVLRSLLGRADV